MIGEISIFGVYLPALLVLALAALVVTGLLTRLFALTGFYRLVAYRPLVDLSVFLLILGLLAALTTSSGLHA
jgi:mannitol-specific phosphotransferase system IIBC component